MRRCRRGLTKVRLRRLLLPCSACLGLQAATCLKLQTNRCAAWTLHAGYRLGAAAGFECGAARGAAATLRALAPRLPADLRSRLQEVEQEQGQGGQQLADMPYQQLQQQVCSGLMAGAPPQPPAAAAAAPVPGCQLLPSVDASLQSLCSALRRVGLQPPEKAVIE